jgi:hypothetical protein
MGPEEYDHVSNLLRKILPGGKCPMCKNPFYSNDPTYTNLILNTHRGANYIFRYQSCAYVMGFDGELFGQFENKN